MGQTGPLETARGHRYEVDAFLRPGRFGDLWRAHRRGDDLRVTVKLLKAERFKDGEAIRRFQREVQLLLQFEHPYLLRVLDHGTTSSGDPFLVLEHKEGRLLSDLVADKPLDVAQVRHIGAQVARVLAAAAAKGIVHRGLCPEAILRVDGTDDVKVLDFGLALPPTASDDVRLTSRGQRIGDVTYMAPEYIEEFVFDARTDLYALGILLYELLTGGPPFQGPTFQVLGAHVSDTPAAPSTRREGVPTWLDQLVLALLRKDPADRPEATGISRAMVVGIWPPPP